MEKAVNKKAAACCNKRAADRAKGPKWLDSALLLDLEKKLLDVFNGQAGFCRGEDDGDIIDAGLVCGEVADAFGYEPIIWVVMTVPIFVGMAAIFVLRKRITVIEKKFQD